MVLIQITQRILLISIPKQHIAIPKIIKLADPTFHLSGEIDLLIGVELFYELLCVGQINLGNGQPYLQKTLLGWLVSGTITDKQEAPTHSVCNISTIEALNQNILKFWELETVNSESSTLSPEERICGNHFMHTTKRQQALKRFYSLERKLNKNPQIKQEYLELGHMRPLEKTNKTFSVPHFFLPHHAVFKENSSTTRLRVVFDASAKTSTNVSLNDVIMVGPK